MEKEGLRAKDRNCGYLCIYNVPAHVVCLKLLTIYIYFKGFDTWNSLHWHFRAKMEHGAWGFLTVHVEKDGVLFRFIWCIAAINKKLISNYRGKRKVYRNTRIVFQMQQFISPKCASLKNQGTDRLKCKLPVLFMQIHGTMRKTLN